MNFFDYNVGRCKQKQRGLRGLLCRWPSITEWEMCITAQGPRLRNDLYCVEWDVKLYYTIPAILINAVNNALFHSNSRTNQILPQVIHILRFFW